MTNAITVPSDKKDVCYEICVLFRSYASIRVSRCQLGLTGRVIATANEAHVPTDPTGEDDPLRKSHLEFHPPITWAKLCLVL